MRLHAVVTNRYNSVIHYTTVQMSGHVSTSICVNNILHLINNKSLSYLATPSTGRVRGGGLVV